VLTSHITLFRTTTRSCMGRVYANPTGYFGAVQRDEIVGLETESSLVCGWWAVSRIVHG
jgi:hypothetical protein